MPETIIDVEYSNGVIEEVSAPLARDAHYEAGKRYLTAKEFDKALEEFDKCRRMLENAFTRGGNRMEWREAGQTTPQTSAKRLSLNAIGSRKSLDAVEWDPKQTCYRNLDDYISQCEVELESSAREPVISRRMSSDHDAASQRNSTSYPIMAQPQPANSNTMPDLAVSDDKAGSAASLPPPSAPAMDPVPLSPASSSFGTAASAVAPPAVQRVDSAKSSGTPDAASTDTDERRTSERKLIERRSSSKLAAELAGTMRLQAELQPGESHVFIGYRQQSDAELAEMLHDKLRVHGLVVWWDQVSMSPGESWHVQVPDGLSRSWVFVPIVSRQGLAPLTKLSSEDGPCDYVLLEYLLAQQVCGRGTSLKKVVPLLVGDRSRDRPSYGAEAFFGDFFQTFQKEQLPETALLNVASALSTALERSQIPYQGDAWTVRSAVEGILGYQGYKFSGLKRHAFSGAIDVITNTVQELVARSEGGVEGSLDESSERGGLPTTPTAYV